jgi:hypothetical protein
VRQHYPLNSNGAEDAGQLPWADGVPSTGVQGSYPGHAIVTDAEAEILAAIDASGQTRSGSDLAQLIQAIARGVFIGQFGGTANALTTAIPNNVVLLSLQTGVRITGIVSATNTGGVTLKVVGIGTAAGSVQAPLLRRDGTALQAGDVPVGQLFDVRWDGSAFRMVGAVASDVPSGILKLTPKGQTATSNFTPNVVLSDLPAANTDYTTQTIAISGASYAVVTSTVALRNDQSTNTGVISAVSCSNGAGSQYIGARILNGVQIPLPVRWTFRGLDPAQSYTFTQRVRKDTTVGPILALDAFLLAEHDGN